MSALIKETIESPEHGVALPESHRWKRMGKRHVCGLSGMSFFTIAGVVPLPVESTLPPPLPLTPVHTQEVWTEPISLERVRPMGRKLTLFRSVDFAKISRSSRFGYREGDFLWENVRHFH